MVGIAAVMGGCGSVNGTGSGSATLSGIDASGAVMGQKGRLRIFFSNPVGSATDVKLTSSSTSIATIADKVTVPAGAVSADVDFQGVAPGEVVFEAVAGTDSQSTATNVVDMLRVNPPGSTTLEVGAHGILGVGVNIRVPDAVQVSLASSQTSVATVDGTVTIPQFSESSIAQVTAVAPGASIITASLNGYQATQTVTVVDKAQITNAYATNLMEAGGHGYAQVSLNAQLATAAMLTVTSSDSSVVMAPAAVTMAAGSTYAQFNLDAISAGATNLTFTLNGSSNSAPVTVLSKAQLEGVNIQGTPSVGAATQLYVYMDVVAAAPHDVQLTSSDPTVVAVPSTVTVFAGTNGTSVSVMPLKTGDSVITATFNGISRQVDFHVGGAAGYSLNLYGQNRYTVGSIGSLSVQTGTNTPTTVSLSSSDPTVISVPSSIVVANYSETAPLNVLKAGSVTITANSGAAAATYQITVVNSSSISYFGPTFNVSVNGNTNAYVQLDTAPPLGTQITFTSSNPSVVQAPPAVTITSQGQTYVSSVIQAGATSGTATITASVGSSSASAVVYVGGSTTGGGGVFTAVYPNCYASWTLELGATAVYYAYYNTPPPTGDTGTISFSTPGIVTTPSTNLTIASNSYQGYFSVTGAVAGSTAITVTTTSGVQTTPASYNPTVVSTPTYTLGLSSSTFKVGATVSATITSSALVAANKTFTLSSTAPGIATPVSQTATIGPGCTVTTTFGVKGVAAGTATINAVIGTTTLTANVTVSP
ncbi:MAG: beta strand repeat-containing protein [Acidobacteriota bacterium]